MIYLKINEQIRQMLDSVRDSFRLGCKEYCSKSLIALDEFELLRKEMDYKNIKKLTDEEYRTLIKSTESFYLHYTHTCQSEEITPKNEEKGRISNSENEEERILEEFKKDKISESNKNKKKEYFSNDPFEVEYLRKKREEEEQYQLKAMTVKSKTENSASYAFSMIGSLFLLVLGSYYLGKYFLNLNDSNTYKLVLVITIIVLLSEMILIVLKMNKESEKDLTHKKIKESSFAYKFNKKYRDNCVTAERRKVHPLIKPKTE